MKYIKLLYIMNFFLLFDQRSIITKIIVSPQKSSSDMQDIKVLRSSDLYKNLQNQIETLQDQFFTKISDKIETLDSYSSQKSEGFLTFLNDEVTGFRSQIKILANQTISDYFSFLTKNDTNFSSRADLSASEIAFVDGVDNIAQESLVIVQKMVLDITSKNVEQNVSLEIKHGFFESERHAQILYEQQLKANEEAANKSWWDQVKGYGKSYLNELEPIAKKTIGKEVAQQTQSFVNEVGAEASSEVGKQISDIAKKNISPALSGKLEALSQKLEKISPLLKEKIGGLTGALKDKGLNFWESESPYNNIALAALRKVVRFKNKIAVTEDISVRSAKGLCLQEQEYLKNRTKITEQVLKEKFGIEQPLRIAFCCSGGGNRAMVGTLGMFAAAAKHNLLQASTYIVGLSGSTWTIAPWVYLYSKGLINTDSYQDSLMDLKNNFIKTLDDASMLDPLKNKSFTPPMLKGSAQKDFANQIVERFSFDQPISAVNPWGALIGNYALDIAKDSRLDLVWSELDSLVTKGDLPLPLCSAGFDARIDLSDSSKKDVGSEYEWFETGPFEAGSKVLGYIPMKYFGSPFNQGKIISELACPEYPMSFYLGVYGSAFSLSINDLVEKGLKDPKVDVMGESVTIPVAQWIKKMFEENDHTQASSKRHGKMHAQFANFSKGLSDSYLKDKDLIGLFDGAMAFNIPLPLVLDHKDRAVDIVIIYDSSPGDLQALQLADAYFKRKNISVPAMGTIKKKDLLDGKYPMTIFNDPRTKSYDKEQPTLIYFPTNVDVSKPPFATSNFKYTKDSINTLMSKVAGSFENHINDIKTVMKQVADARKERSRGINIVDNKSKPQAKGMLSKKTDSLSALSGKNIPAWAYGLPKNKFVPPTDNKSNVEVDNKKSEEQTRTIAGLDTKAKGMLSKKTNTTGLTTAGQGMPVWGSVVSTNQIPQINNSYDLGSEKKTVDFTSKSAKENIVTKNDLVDLGLAKKSSKKNNY